MDPNIFKPGYRIEIKNEAQARIYRRLLLAKIAVQLVILGGLLALSGWDWKMFLGVAAIATVWQFGPKLWRKFKHRQAQA
jgi:hypothetical protein